MKNRIALAVAALLAVATPAYGQVSVYGRNTAGKQFSVINTGTAATDNAYLEAKVSGAAAGDPHLRLTIPTGTSWYFGSDNSDSDGLKWGTGTAVGTNMLLHLTTAGVLRVNAAAWETPVVTNAPLQVMGAGNIFAIVRQTTADVELAVGAISTAGNINTQTNHPLILGANNNAATLNLETDGRVWGNHLHNTGTVTGTTNQYVASGTYTPTLTNTTNVAASTARKCQWIRVGNVVSVSGSADIDPTAAAATVMEISLPIASNLALATDLAGTAEAPGVTAANAASAAVLGSAANDRALVQWTAVDVTNQTWYFHFQYEVL